MSLRGDLHLPHDIVQLQGLQLAAAVVLLHRPSPGPNSVPQDGPGSNAVPA